MHTFYLMPDWEPVSNSLLKRRRPNGCPGAAGIKIKNQGNPTIVGLPSGYTANFCAKDWAMTVRSNTL
jgi:hypothetical protein